MLFKGWNDLNFMKRIITGDVQWVYKYDMAIEQQASELIVSGELKQEGPLQIKSQIKTLLNIFLVSCGAIHYDGFFGLLAVVGNCIWRTTLRTYIYGVLHWANYDGISACFSLSYWIRMKIPSVSLPRDETFEGMYAKIWESTNICQQTWQLLKNQIYGLILSVAKVLGLVQN